jgi:hypothetical protein
MRGLDELGGVDQIEAAVDGAADALHPKAQVDEAVEAPEGALCE